MLIKIKFNLDNNIYIIVIKNINFIIIEIFYATNVFNIILNNFKNFFYNLDISQPRLDKIPGFFNIKILANILTIIIKNNIYIYTGNK